MSHFVISVITTPNSPDVDELLAPYSEHLEVESYIDASKSQLINEGKDIQKHTKKRVETLLKEKPEYKPTEREEKILALTTDDDFHSYMTEGCEVDEDGNRLSSYNPNSKWDWYVVGGRWPDMLKLKDGTRADEAQIKDIDFSPDEQVFKDALDFWDGYVLEQDPEKYENVFYKREYFLENYTRKGYARQQATFYTRAVVTPDGQWHEVGQMGWFGMSSESGHERTDWADKWYNRFIKNEDPEATLTIIDCYI